ncbi:hypothetical protein GF385_02235 [Candidatus Dependentiae bacterium]|nr:hypothetical protein [Candidatus Dependentiae bacterium]
MSTKKAEKRRRTKFYNKKTNFKDGQKIEELDKKFKSIDLNSIKKEIDENELIANLLITHIINSKNIFYKEKVTLLKSMLSKYKKNDRKKILFYILKNLNKFAYAQYNYLINNSNLGIFGKKTENLDFSRLKIDDIQLFIISSLLELENTEKLNSVTTIDISGNKLEIYLKEEEEEEKILFLKFYDLFKKLNIIIS